MKQRVSYLLLLLYVCLNGCYKEVGIPVHADFGYRLADSSRTVPVTVSFSNKSNGATSYKWTFEGGEPAVSSFQNPGTVIFRQAGTYKITLEAWNEDERQQKTMMLQLDSAVAIGFDTLVRINHYAPVEVEVINKTTGGTTFSWTFDNGTPATFSGTTPPVVTFTAPGDHTITLRVSNGGQQFTVSKVITVLPAVTADADWQYAFEDEDQEAPLTALLESKAANYLSQQWTAPGGVIKNDTAGKTTVYFTNPGTYQVTLKATNNKESKQVTKTITVKPNSFLTTLTDIRFGINSAHTDPGAFYAIRLRKNFKKGDDLSTAGKEIDISFFGLSQTFGYNKFISPDSVHHYAFTAIPGATWTRFMNTIENCNCQIGMSVAAFDNMQDDALLKGFHIPPEAIGYVPFDQSVTPRIVLFETQDGRRGAIKIKKFVAAGTASYIVADIKVQKYE